MWCHWNKRRRCSVWIREKWIHPPSPHLLIFRNRVNERSGLARTGGTTLILVQMCRATDYLLPWSSITKYLTHHLASVKAAPAQILPLTKLPECTGSSYRWYIVYSKVYSDCEVDSNIWSLKVLVNHNGLICEAKELVAPDMKGCDVIWCFVPVNTTREQMQMDTWEGHMNKDTWQNE